MRFKVQNPFIHVVSETLEIPSVPTETTALLFLVCELVNYKFNSIIGA